MARFYARATRGVEWIAAAEIEALHDAQILATGHREIEFSTDSISAAWSLRTVDDVFIHAANVDNVGRSRQALSYLATLPSAALIEALKVVASVRPVGGREPFTVSASMLGRRNYNRFEVEQVVGKRIEAVTGASFYSRTATAAPPRTRVSWRVHIKGTKAVVGLRLSEFPLHRRQYRRSTVPGSLRPPVAAALALVGGVVPGQLLLDPFCGAGTIPLEYTDFSAGLSAVGSDISPEWVNVARGNARAASRPINLLVADARRLPFGSASVDLVVANPPWDRQVPMRRSRRDDGRIWDEIARVVRPTGRMVVLTERPVHPPDGWRSFNLGWCAVAGSNPRFIVLVPERSSVLQPEESLYADKLRHRLPDVVTRQTDRFDG